MESVLELREVSKHFPTHRAVDGISLAIERGALYGLLGPSGCGKTTTLRLIAGFDSPTTGDILLNGGSLVPLKPYQRNVNTVFQSYALFPHMTVRGNIEFGLKRKNVSDCDARVKRVVDLVQLTGKESRLPAELSGGEKQRVALARSLVLEPEVLLLDEPLSALDPNLRKQVRSELKELQRRTGITFVIVTHDQEEALSLCDKIAVMNKGKVEQIGTPEDIYLRPGTRFVAEFLGAMNWFDRIGVRPEATRISKTASDRSLEAVVESSMFLGHCVQVRGRTPAGVPFVAEIPRAENRFALGDSVQVSWNRADEIEVH
jgi:spermidine/putrescine transport system ATP-binding protein